MMAGLWLRLREIFAAGNGVEAAVADGAPWMACWDEGVTPWDLVFRHPPRPSERPSRFFCAFDPSLRSAWASKMDHLPKPDGELIALMFLLEGAEVGLPFNTAVHDYEEVLQPLGFVITSIEDNQFAVETRKGKEKLARWKKMAN